jgi:4a-hydroxytetrahydrobiopterin dehydratase
VTTIGEPEARQRLTAEPALSGWELDGAAIRQRYTFPSFADALAFVVRLGFDAEAADHHPDILVNFKRVTLTFTTHSEGGLTERDFAGAARANEIASSMGGL